MTLALHLLAFVVGLSMVIGTIFSAIRAFVLPRSVHDGLSRRFFLFTRMIFMSVASLTRTFKGRDRVMAMYAPVSLICLPGVWLTVVLAGYTGMFWALGQFSWEGALAHSGSSLLTLGYAAPSGLVATALTLTEAAIGLILVALLIAYLPTIYTAFSRREAAVTMLEVRAGSPPSAVELILRYYRIHGLNHLGEVWNQWEQWFVDIEESHTSLAALSFFRSPQPHRSWVTAAGAVLDAASLVASTVEAPPDPHTNLCIRAGFLALRYIADYFFVPYNPAPTPDDPISVSRAEYDAAYDLMASKGVPLKPDREQAWRDFVGWRVNYDAVLIALAYITMAPPAPWSSDRPAPPHFKGPKRARRPR